MPLEHIQEHIDIIAKHEQEFLAQRTRTERLGDSIAQLMGSLPFVVFHVAFFVLWMAVNALPLGVPHFDPAPFALLGTILAMEAILLASFILMRQQRTSRRADQRDHLMLQILLLTEREATATLAMERRMAEKMGLQKAANDPAIRELSQHTPIDDVAQTIKESLPSE